MRYLVTILSVILPLQFSYLTDTYGFEVDLSESNHYFVQEIVESVFRGKDGKLTKVVLDAGHGGKDHGCTVKPNREKDIALNIVLYLGKIIEQEFPEVEVIYTRKSDVFVPLYKRIRMANENDADLFISIHCNYSQFPKVKGSESYVMGLHTAVENLNVAKRENAAVLHEVDFEKNYDGYNPNSPAGHIILSMYQHAYLSQSIEMAQKVENAFKTEPKIKSRGVKQAGFVVLKKATMPSVLIEAGYLSNKEDAIRLATREGQKTVAQNIFEAFKNYKKDVENIKPKEISNRSSEIKKATENSIVAAKVPEKKDLNKKNYLPNTTFTKQYRNGENPSREVQSKRPIDELVYKIQIAASRGKPLQMNGMKWKEIEEIDMKVEDGMYKYLTGKYNSLESALLAQKQMIDKGFNGAFIVAYDGDERIGLKKAKEIISQKNNF